MGFIFKLIAMDWSFYRSILSRMTKDEIISVVAYLVGYSRISDEDFKRILKKIW